MTIELIALLISSAAVIVSIFSIRISKKYAKHQIIVGKIEEAYEISEDIFHYYRALRVASMTLEDSQNQKYDSRQRKKLAAEYTGIVDNLRKHEKIRELHPKVSRLKVLANAYMESDLKIKTLAYCDIFDKLMLVSFQGEIMYKNVFYKEGFPTSNSLGKFLYGLEQEFVKKIGHGGKAASQEEVSNYRENHLKFNLGMKFEND